MFNEEDEKLRKRWPPPRIVKPLNSQEGKDPAKSPKARTGLKTANSHSAKTAPAARSNGVKGGHNGSVGGHNGSVGGHGGSSGGHGGHGGSGGGHGGSGGGHGGSGGGH